MSIKTRLTTVILAGLLLGLVAVKLQRSSVPMEKALIAYDDATRNDAIKKFANLKSTEEKSRIVGELATKNVKSKDPRVRVYALYALRKSGWSGTRVVNAMVQALGDPDPKVRQEAEVGLREIGPPAVGSLLYAMGNPAARNASREVLRQLPPTSLPIIGKALDNKGQRRGATYMLSKINRPDTLRDAKKFLPVLVENLKSTDTVLAVNSAFALNNIDPDDSRPYAVFLKCIRQPKWEPWDVRGWEALQELERKPGYREQTVAALKEMLPKSQDGWAKGRRFMRPAIGDTLNRLSPMSDDIGSLTAALKSESPSTRWRAVYAIGSPATVNQQALGPLVTALDDKDNAVAARAFYALDRIGLANAERAGSTVYPRLIATFERVGNAVPGFWQTATNAIAGLGEKALAMTMGAVGEGKLSPEKAISIVRAVSVDAGPVPFLEKALSNPNADVRFVAAMGLARFQPKSQAALNELEKNRERGPQPLKEEVQRTIDSMNKAK